MSIPSFQPSTSPSLIQSIDPRVRIAISFCFAIIASLSKDFSPLGLSLVFSLGIALFAGIIHRRTLRRVLGLNAFMAFLLLFLPLSISGTPMISIGKLVWSYEGVVRAAMITLKANTIMLTFAALMATIEPIRLGMALNTLGCPDKLTHLLFFSVRYLDVIYREYRRALNAMKLRCFRPGFNRHTFRTYGYLVGVLLIKSIDRSERILDAMKCRGFRNRFYTLTTLTLTRNDVLFMLSCSGIIIVIICLEWL